MSLKISRILHAGYLFESEGVKIVFDPIFENPFSRNCHAFPDVKFDRDQIRDLRLSAVFISHFHDDHCSLDSLNLLKRETPIYIYCLFEELATMIRELGFSQVHQLQIGSPVDVGPIRVLPLRALDSEVDSMFHISAAGINILNVVDSWINPEDMAELAKQAPWDLVLWPFQTLRETEVLSPSRALPASRSVPSEWVEQLRALSPQWIVPSSCQFIHESWSWFNQFLFPISYSEFEWHIGLSLPETTVMRMNPSVSIQLKYVQTEDRGGAGTRLSVERAESLSWVLPVGEQSLDYTCVDNLVPPPTGDIAKRFPALSEAQRKRVLEYCNHELIEKHNALGPSAEPYFRKTRIWRLSLYDHLGNRQDFHYQLKGGSLLALPGPQFPLAWLTEVPMWKLFSALEQGESLSSMYVRINDSVFEPSIEAEIELADVIEDPLIRSLFHGVFGAYQKEQLRRLQQGRIQGEKRDES